ncbi:hypothetical protein [Escherichia phage LHE71]|uniref:Uncharacterized protein n=1 Tax=Escherichia phage LHE71 TaxID=2982898 RepID=A0A9X9JV39_9CAUD|nr:hypothetical protein [Escherichia phage LHE71]
MTRIGWLVNGVFYPLSDESTVNRIRQVRPNIQIIPIFSGEPVCVSYQ